MTHRATTRPFDRSADKLMRFALSIKERSVPCLRKHDKGDRAEGATDAEIAYVFALIMREAAGADEYRTAGVLSGLLTADDSGACG